MALGGQRPRFVLVSSAGTFDLLPAAARLVLGQYAEDGWNHGKRVYRRMKVHSQKFHPEAVLFYWDERNGSELSGWWVGSQVAGGEVWARNASAEPVPPELGWRCPVDGPVQEHLRCVQPMQPPRRSLGFAKEEPRDGGDEGPSPVAARKRPLEGASPAWPAKRPQRQTFVLLSRHALRAPEGCARLLGEYAQQAYSQGRKTFRREAEAAASDGPVWLYYADGGWWLGEAVGAKGAYALARQQTLLPPREGWRAPPEGPVREDLCLVPKGREAEVEMWAAAPMDRQLQKAWAIVSRVESESERAVEASQSLLDRGGGEAAPQEALSSVMELLRARAGEAEAALQALGASARPAVKQEDGEDAMGEVGLLAERLRIALSAVQEELARAERELESFDLRALEQFGQQEAAAQEEEEEDRARNVEQQEALARWSARSLALALGDAGRLRECRELIRERILQGHAAGSLRCTDWDAEPVVDLGPPASPPGGPGVD